MNPSGDDAAAVVAVQCMALAMGAIPAAFFWPVSGWVLPSLAVATIALMTIAGLRRHEERPEARWLQTLKVWQRRSVQRIGAHLKLTMLALIGLAVIAAGALPFLGGTFMPDFREGHFVMQVSSSIPGTSLDAMLDAGKRISAEILALPYVQSVEQQVGRAELGEVRTVRGERRHGRAAFIAQAHLHRVFAE